MTGERRTVVFVAVLAVVVAAALGSTLLDWGARPAGGATAGSGLTQPTLVTPTGAAVATRTPPIATGGPATRRPRPSTGTVATESIPSVDANGTRTIAMTALPKEARLMLDIIAAGGPFRYTEDGSTFGNVEGLLPKRGAGYYREYTVETPGSPDRGARRIVMGPAGERYWTADHYASFRRILP